MWLLLFLNSKAKQAESLTLQFLSAKQSNISEARKQLGASLRARVALRPSLPIMKPCSGVQHVRALSPKVSKAQIEKVDLSLP